MTTIIFILIGILVQIAAAPKIIRDDKLCEMLGWPLDEVLQKTLNAMRDCEARVANEIQKI